MMTIYLNVLRPVIMIAVLFSILFFSQKNGKIVGKIKIKMTDQEFKSALHKFRFYLKPQMFEVLVESSDAFSDQTKIEIIEKLQEADNQMKELHDYQLKRNDIMKRGVDKMSRIYENMKKKYQQLVSKEEDADARSAEKLISNM